MDGEPDTIEGALSPQEEPRAPPPAWSSAAQTVAAVLWPSFLAAALATMVCFAFIDPEHLVEVTTPPVDLSRTASYGVGFFFFWLIGLVAAALCWNLSRPPRDG